jgi:hypothetical protein
MLSLRRTEVPKTWLRAPSCVSFATRQNTIKLKIVSKKSTGSKASATPEDAVLPKINLISDV